VYFSISLQETHHSAEKSSIAGDRSLCRGQLTVEVRYRVHELELGPGYRCGGGARPAHALQRLKRIGISTRRANQHQHSPEGGGGTDPASKPTRARNGLAAPERTEHEHRDEQ